SYQNLGDSRRIHDVPEMASRAGDIAHQNYGKNEYRRAQKATGRQDQSSLGRSRRRSSGFDSAHPPWRENGSTNFGSKSEVARDAKPRPAANRLGDTEESFEPAPGNDCRYRSHWQRQDDNFVFDLERKKRSFHQHRND